MKHAVREHHEQAHGKRNKAHHGKGRWKPPHTAMRHRRRRCRTPAATDRTDSRRPVEHQFTEEEKNFVVQFAFRSGSKEDTISLIEALAHSADKAESDEIMVTYRSKYDMKPAWVEQVENLLVALEMYRIEEEKAINHLADILTAYGIDVSAEEIRTTETETLKTTVREKVEVR